MSRVTFATTETVVTDHVVDIPQARKAEHGYSLTGLTVEQCDLISLALRRESRENEWLSNSELMDARVISRQLDMAVRPDDTIIDLTTDERILFRKLIEQDKFISAIRLVRHTTGAPLRRAKKWTESSRDGILRGFWED